MIFQVALKMMVSKEGDNMLDFVGNILKIGDKVVCCCMSGNTKDMFMSEVIGFTERMVKISKKHPWQSTPYSIVSPNNCIVYKQPEDCTNE